MSNAVLLQSQNCLLVQFANAPRSALAALDPNEANDNPASPPSTHASPVVTKAKPAERSKSPVKVDDKTDV